MIQIKNEVFMNCLLNITNGGIVTNSQDASITVFALNNYVEIPKVFYDYPSDYKMELLSMPDISADKPKNVNIIDMKAKDLKASIQIESEMSKKEDAKDDTKSQASEDRNGDDDSDLEDNGMNDGALETNIVRTEDRFGKEFWLKRYEKVTNLKHTYECVDKNTPLKKLSPDELECRHTLENGSPLGANWRRDPANGLELLDKELLDNQRKVLGHFLKTMGKNLFEGKSIMSISMPITVFSDDSMLQRVPSGYGYLPYFLPKAAELNDPLEAFKLCVTFFFTSIHLAIRQEKPFNPILGETYQGYIGGIPIFCEQIIHHPPISAIYVRRL